MNQANCINLSYRNRGYTLRTNKNKLNQTINIKILPLLNNKEDKAAKNITAPYSPKKIKIKPRLPNSTLNPEISSLSASLKSKGARFVSAKTLKNQGKLTGKNKNLTRLLLSRKGLMDIELTNINIVKTKKAKEIS